MDVQAILDNIDRQFAQAQKVRELFVSVMEGDAPPAERPCRPKGLADRTTETITPAPKRAGKPAKRTMSAEGKARIAAAQKKRWAAQKQAQESATRKYAAKKTASATVATTADA